MKKTIALTLVIFIFSLMFTACAETLSGSYSSSADLLGIVGGSVTLKFKGDTVTVSLKASVLGLTGGKSFQGTYKITKDVDDTRLITFALPSNKYVDSLNGTFEFSEGRNDDGDAFISIGRMTFIKNK